MKRNYVQSQQFRLALGVVTGTQTVRVRDLVDIDGNVIDMTFFGDKGYGTLEPNTPREESITFTGITNNNDGTWTLTGVSNVGASDTMSETSGVQKNHVGGSVFVFSNTSFFYKDQFLNRHNDENVLGDYTFEGENTVNVSQGARLSVDDEAYNPSDDEEYMHKGATDRTYLNLSGDTMDGDIDMDGNSITDLADPVNDKDAANKEYVDGIALAGAPNADETTKGVVQEATQAQVDNGTDVGSTGARLFVPPSKLSKPPKQTIITSTNTWTVPTGLKAAIVEIQAAGGNGGNSTSSSATSRATGGSGGGYAKKFFEIADLTDPDYTITINSSEISFGSLMSANNGVNGTSNLSTTDTTDGPVGGTATGGDINIQGARGHSTFNSFYIPGGDSVLGRSLIATANGNGPNGQGFGSGGGGSRAAGTGGTGAPAICIITEFY